MSINGRIHTDVRVSCTYVYTHSCREPQEGHRAWPSEAVHSDARMGGTAAIVHLVAVHGDPHAPAAAGHPGVAPPPGHRLQVLHQLLRELHTAGAVDAPRHPSTTGRDRVRSSMLNRRLFVGWYAPELADPL